MPFVQRGQPHALAVVRDISERRRRERELQRSEARFRATVEAAFDSVVVMDSNGLIVEFNAAAERVFGHRREDVLGRRMADVIIPQRLREAHASGVSNFRGQHSGGLVGRLVETTALRADGTEFPVEVAISVAAVPQEGGMFVGHLRDITDRRRAEQALRDSEEQYRAIFNASADALVLRAADFSIVDVNATYEAMSGNSRAEVLGLDEVVANPPALTAERRALHERALLGETVRLETDLMRRDGHRYEIELRGVPIQHRGQPHVLYIGRDITQGKHAERALRDSEEQYRAIFNASADALVLRAADFSIVDVNATYEAMSGFARAEVLGVARVLANPPEVMATIRALHEKALAGEAIALDTQMFRRDGHCYDLDLRGVPIQHRGQPHVLYIGRDITQRKRAERALRASEEQYRSIFNASADALVLRDARFRAVEVNPAYATLTGYTREEVMAADSVLTQPDPAVRARFQVEHELALAGKELRFEVNARHKDGRALQAEVRGTPMMYRGQPHVLYAVRDITERNAAEQRRNELERQLRQAQKMEAIGQLTGGIAHDFNNILTSVLGYVAMAHGASGVLPRTRCWRASSARRSWPPNGRATMWRNCWRSRAHAAAKGACWR